MQLEWREVSHYYDGHEIWTAKGECGLYRISDTNLNNGIDEDMPLFVKLHERDKDIPTAHSAISKTIWKKEPATIDEAKAAAQKWENEHG